MREPSRLPLVYIMSNLNIRLYFSCNFGQRDQIL